MIVAKERAVQRVAVALSYGQPIHFNVPQKLMPTSTAAARLQPGPRGLLSAQSTHSQTFAVFRSAPYCLTKSSRPHSHLQTIPSVLQISSDVASRGVPHRQSRCGSAYDACCSLLRFQHWQRSHYFHDLACERSDLQVSRASLRDLPAATRRKTSATVPFKPAASS